MFHFRHAFSSKEEEEEAEWKGEEAKQCQLSSSISTSAEEVEQEKERVVQALDGGEKNIRDGLVKNAAEQIIRPVRIIQRTSLVKSH